MYILYKIVFLQELLKTNKVMKEKSIKINVPEGYEIDEANSSFSEIKFKLIECKYPKSWKDAFIGKEINGYWVDEDSSIKYANYEADSEDYKVFKKEKQAKAMLAYAQITQLMALPCYNGDWEPIYGDCNKVYPIYRNADEIIRGIFFDSYFKISFKTQKARDAFYDNHMDLLKTYFELD